MYLGQESKEFLLNLNSAQNGFPLIVGHDCRVLFDFVCLVIQLDDLKHDGYLLNGLVM